MVSRRSFSFVDFGPFLPLTCLFPSVFEALVNGNGRHLSFAIGECFSTRRVENSKVLC